MGLAAQILWLHPATASSSRALPQEPARAVGSLDEGFTDWHLRWLLLTFRVGTLAIALFQSAYITQAVYCAHSSVFADSRTAFGADLLVVILPLFAFGLSFC
jgi:hypothetical protein